MVFPSSFLTTAMAHLDLAPRSPLIGTSISMAEGVDGPRPKPKRVLNKNPRSYEKQFRGVDGYVYSVKYFDGKITLNNVACPEKILSSARSHALSITDWRRLTKNVCKQIDLWWFNDTPFVCQWSSATGPEIYRVESGCSPTTGKGILFLSACLDREAQKNGLGNMTFENLFFIQQQDLRSLRRVFRKVDDVIRGDRVNSYMEGVRKRLVFDSLSISTDDFLVRNSKN